MSIIAYKVKEGEHHYYDFSTIKDLLNMDRSKLQRDLRRIAKADFIKYKNQHLYKQEVLFILMEEQLMKGLDKIGPSLNEHS